MSPPLTRREFPAKVRLAAFRRADGHCEECSASLVPGKFQYDHEIADAIGGEPTLENCVVRCDTCHSLKTRTHDVPAAAKAKRREAKHAGIKTTVPRPIVGAPFPIGKGRKSHPMPLPPRRSMFGS